MEKLFSLLNAIAPMPPRLTELLQTSVESTLFLKGDYILREGQVCQHIYILESGLVRIFNRLAEKEVTSWFLMEEDIFISVSSFFKQQPSYENIMALEDLSHEAPSLKFAMTIITLKEKEFNRNKKGQEWTFFLKILFQVLF